MSLYGRKISELQNGDLSVAKKVELLSQRVWNSKNIDRVSILSDCDHVPTMLTQEEKMMLNWLTRYYVEGEGHIVDLGAFLGGSTIQLCHGLANNKNLKGNIETQVYSYDRFELSEEYKEKWLYSKGVDKIDGTDALPFVKGALENYSSKLKLHKGDFLEQNWDAKPIEVLFVDIAKTWALSDHIVTNFFTNLIPGKSIVVQQDMLFVNCPWICAVMFRLKDYFKFISTTEQYSVLFLNTQKIDSNIANWALANKFTERDVINSIDFFIDKIDYFPNKEVLHELKLRFIKNPHATLSWQLN